MESSRFFPECDDGWRCAVCLEEQSGPPQFTGKLPCGHADFHFECVRKWLVERESRCPLCKSEVRELIRVARRSEANRRRSEAELRHGIAPRRQSASDDDDEVVAAALAESDGDDERGYGYERDDGYERDGFVVGDDELEFYSSDEERQQGARRDAVATSRRPRRPRLRRHPAARPTPSTPVGRRLRRHPARAATTARSDEDDDDDDADRKLDAGRKRGSDDCTDARKRARKGKGDEDDLVIAIMTRSPAAASPPCRATITQSECSDWSSSECSPARAAGSVAHARVVAHLPCASPTRRSKRDSIQSAVTTPSGSDRSSAESGACGASSWEEETQIPPRESRSSYFTRFAYRG